MVCDTEAFILLHIVEQFTDQAGFSGTGGSRDNKENACCHMIVVPLPERAVVEKEFTVAAKLFQILGGGTAVFVCLKHGLILCIKELV